MDIPWTKLVRSTMVRATETAEIIAQYLPNVEKESCSLIEEGAPIPPEPPIGHWRPEKQVSFFFF